MAKWMTGSGCHLGGEWSWSRMGVLDGGGDRRKGKRQFGGKCGHCGASH